MMIQRNKPEYLYLHVPFCRTICAYCDFCHLVYSQKTAEKWLDTLAEEISLKEISPDLRTVYIGGGTPSCLDAFMLNRLLDLLDPYTHHVQEYTMEINPETVDEEKVRIMADHHVSRVSIGFQSSDPSLLKLMGRHHDLKMIADTMNLFRKYGIENISLDLMYSLPFQTMDILKQSVHDAISLKPEHLSLYSLTIEENTVFGKKGYHHLDDDTEADMYEFICHVLPGYGYHQYEVSNFARDGYESVHNSAYWNYRDFYGIGMGASGKEGYLRYDNTRSLNEYLKDPLKRTEIPLTEKEAMFEMLMMGMRFRKGMDLSLFEETFHHDFQEVYGRKAEPLIQKGLVEYSDNHIRCTDQGYEIMNSVLVEFMDDE